MDYNFDFRLKGAVQNDNCPYLGQVRIPIPANSKVALHLQSTEANTLNVTVENGNLLNGAGTDFDMPHYYPDAYMQASFPYTGNAAAVIIIDDYYKIAKMQLGVNTLPASDVAEIDWNFLKYSKIIEIITGETCGIYLTGNIEDAVDFKNISNVTKFELRNTKIKGKWEYFVAGLVKKGITTKSIGINNGSNGQITFKGSSATEGTSISWAPNTNPLYTDITIGTDSCTIDADGNIITT